MLKCQENVHVRVSQDLWALEMHSDLPMFWFQCQLLGKEDLPAQSVRCGSPHSCTTGVKIKWQICLCLEF